MSIVSNAADSKHELGNPVQNNENVEDEVDQEQQYEFWGYTISQTALLIGMSITGMAMGLILNSSAASPELVTWISLPGGLFLRVLKCLVIPMIFCNMVMGVADLSKLGQQGTIGARTFALYMCTTMLACVEGLIIILMFRGFFANIHVETAPGTKLSFKCSDGQDVAESDGGALVCGGTGNAAFETTIDSGELFVTTALISRSVADTIQAIFKSIFTDNIFKALLTPDVLSVIVFAVAFGYFASSLKVKQGEKNHVIELFGQLNDVLQNMVKLVVRMAPYAVFFMIAGALASASNIIDLLQNVGVLVIAVILGHLVHVLVTLPALFFFFVRRNPYTYMSKCVRAYTFAFGCASSGATLPVTTQCVESTGEVPTSVARFVLSLGATINMDGSAIYFPACMVFLADTAGYSDLVTFGTLITILLVSTVGAVGASPIPNAGLVMIVTIWEAVFSGIAIPNQVAYLQAIDWLLDRSVTVVNVCGDSLVARIVTAMIQEKGALQENLLDQSEKDGYSRAMSESFGERAPSVSVIKEIDAFASDSVRPMPAESKENI